jgi:hypothetical protein
MVASARCTAVQRVFASATYNIVSIFLCDNLRYRLEYEHVITLINDTVSSL